MLLAQQRVGALHRLQPPDLANRRLRQGRPRSSDGPTQYAIPCLFAPPRQHERVNVEGLGHCLHLDTWQVT
jgi:hypothetical protein